MNSNQPFAKTSNESKSSLPAKYVFLQTVSCNFSLASSISCPLIFSISFFQLWLSYHKRLCLFPTGNVIKKAAPERYWTQREDFCILLVFHKEAGDLVSDVEAPQSPQGLRHFYIAVSIFLLLFTHSLYP